MKTYTGWAKILKKTLKSRPQASLKKILKEAKKQWKSNNKTYNTKKSNTKKSNTKKSYTKKSNTKKSYTKKSR